MFGFKKKKFELKSPVTGKIVNLDRVPDQIFASKMMGEGIAFDFDDSMVYAPCDGTILIVAETKHAVGIQAENGAEILIHVGLDTVNFQGNGFETFVKASMKVKCGDPLLSIDRNYFLSQNVNLITPMVITNSDKYEFEVISKETQVAAKETVIVKFK